MKTIRIHTLYGENDHKYEGDYVEVHVQEDDVILIRYGDHHSDKGQIAAEAFVCGYTKRMNNEFYAIERTRGVIIYGVELH